MPSKIYLEKEYKVDVEAAWENAALGIMRQAGVGAPGMPDMASGRLKRKPTIIYDINGSPLFYDFQVSGRDGPGGVVRAAASEVLGPPVLAVEIGSRKWNFNVAVKKLMPKIKRGRTRIKIPRPKLVCYSYPKLGVMFEVPDTRGSVKREIFDVASLKPVLPLSARKPREGEFAWSFYESLDNRKRASRQKLYKKDDVMRTKLPVDFRRKLARATTLERVKYQARFARATIVKTLQFCSHYPTTHARSHHCFVLHGQQKNDYCAVATCQMILCYYNYYYSQNQIAPNLGYTSGGGCPPNQSAGYETLTNHHLNATFDSSATWAEARNQINNLQPMKSGVPGHARACAGYSYLLSLWPARITERKLYIYDPWPWNADYRLGGTVYWEDWDAVNHTNFIYTELNY